MIDKIVPSRYAKALLRLTGSEQEAGERYVAALKSVSRLFTHAESQRVLSSPVMPKGVKKQLLSFALEGFDQEKDVLEKFLYMMVDVGRVSAIRGMLDSYRDLIDQANNRRRVDVVSAVPLDHKAEQEFVKTLEAMLESEVIATFKVDSEILGGAVIRLGHQLLDMSLKTRLESVTQ